MTTNPVLKPLPTTPAHEWASNTTASLEQSINEPAKHGGLVGSQYTHTGEHERKVPGSFPQTSDSSSPTTAHGVLGNALQSASDTARHYLPDSVTSYLPGSHGDNPMPSKEVPGGSQVGVGSLPGNFSEASVAKLPDERANEGTIPSPAMAKPTTRAATSSHGMLGAAQNYLPASVAAYLPGAKLASKNTLPSTETPSGSAGGIGSLPGNYSEVSVAKLPEERRQEGFPSHETDHEFLGKTGGVGPLPGGPDESRVALLPEERAHSQDEIYKADSNSGLHMPGTFVDAASKAGAAIPGVAVPKATAEAAGSQGAPKTLSGAHTTSSTTDSPPSAHADRRGSMGSNGGHHKVGLVDKMKGEAKIISGKLGHNERKVEEGKQMMGK